jgi:hypothetical protein
MSKPQYTPKLEEKDELDYDLDFTCTSYKDQLKQIRAKAGKIIFIS